MSCAAWLAAINAATSANCANVSCSIDVAWVLVTTKDADPITSPRVPFGGPNSGNRFAISNADSFARSTRRSMSSLPILSGTVWPVFGPSAAMRQNGQPAGMPGRSRSS